MHAGEQKTFGSLGASCGAKTIELQMDRSWTSALLDPALSIRVLHGFTNSNDPGSKTSIIKHLP